MEQNLVTKLIYKRKKIKSRYLKKIYTKIISLCGADIPINVHFGDNVILCHNCLGSVIYDGTYIADSVKIYQNVTIGQADPLTKNPATISICEGAVICAGAKVLSKNNLVVGKNTIIAANAVLLCSTGENEIWGGIPAHLIKHRE